MIPFSIQNFFWISSPRSFRSCRDGGSWPRPGKECILLVGQPTINFSSIILSQFKETGYLPVVSCNPRHWEIDAISKRGRVTKLEDHLGEVHICLRDKWLGYIYIIYGWEFKWLDLLTFLLTIFLEIIWKKASTICYIPPTFPAWKNEKR